MDFVDNERGNVLREKISRPGVNQPSSIHVIAIVLLIFALAAAYLVVDLKLISSNSNVKSFSLRINVTENRIL